MMESDDNSFYRALNTALRKKDRDILKPSFSFLKLFGTDLEPLIHPKHSIWRGISFLTREECSNLSPCSLDVHVIEHFLVTNGTSFVIEALHVQDSSGYTNYLTEQEVIPTPGGCECRSTYTCPTFTLKIFPN
jgi:hypothetical protein